MQGELSWPDALTLMTFIIVAGVCFIVWIRKYGGGD